MAVRGAGLIIGLALVTAAATAYAEDALIKPSQFPSPPCAGEPSPPFPEIGDTPAVRVWRDAELKQWHRPACLGPGPVASNALIAVAGRFKSEGDIEAIAGRIGAISAYKTIRYFSVRAEAWQVLFKESYALTEPPAGRPANVGRGDFRAEEFDTGHILHFWQEENSLLSGVAYRLTVEDRSPQSLAYTIVNESPAKALLLTASEPGEFRQVYKIEHESGDVWRYYSLVEARMRMGPFNLSSRSLRYRAIAFYRYIAGYRTDADVGTAP